jgi:hypothetical protein
MLFLAGPRLSQCSAQAGTSTNASAFNERCVSAQVGYGVSFFGRLAVPHFFMPFGYASVKVGGRFDKVPIK